MRFRFLVLPLLLGSLATAQTTYYVDAATGDDVNSGVTRDLAFKSITFGVSRCHDDDTLLVMPGTYSPAATGESYPIRVGDPALATQNRVRIVSDQGPAVTIIDGAGLMVDSLTPLMSFRFDASGSSLHGFTLQNTGNSSYWSMCSRLGLPSGGSWAPSNNIY